MWPVFNWAAEKDSMGYNSGVMIYVKRTFHPVGQGAFFTEQFYDETMDNALYNVVYDCGSKSQDIRTQMERDIRNCFHKRKKIDVLFLSHFDEDHVNKVKYLKTEGHLQGTRIFIPMIKEEEKLGIEPYKTNYDYILSLNEQDEEGTKVIKVHFDEGNAEVATPEMKGEPIPFEDIKESEIESGTTMCPKGLGIIWCYTLYNLRFNELVDKFKAGLKAAKLKYEKLEDVDYVAKNISALKGVYQGLGEKPSGGTAINLNSMLVMSYPERQNNCWRIRSRIMYDQYPVDCQYRFLKGYAGSCLYMGDTSANEKSVWDKVELIIKDCLGEESKLTLLQVPHHGSMNSYDEKLVNSDKYLNGFTNYDPYYWQRIFDDDLPMKFAVKEKPLILVTREYGSQYEEYWRVE